MKAKLAVSQDGINSEEFDDLSFFSNDKQIEGYAKSVASSIAEAALNMKIVVPADSLKIIFNGYSKPSSYEWQEYIDRLSKTLNDDKHYIDDVIALLRNSKEKVSKDDSEHYEILKNIVLENCQMEDPAYCKPSKFRSLMDKCVCGGEMMRISSSNIFEEIGQGSLGWD